MPLISSIIGLFNTRRLSQIDLFRKAPMEVQESVFFSLIEEAQNTEWGKKYDFSSIRKISQFQERVPVQDYEGFEPFVHRLRNGEKNVLWPGVTRWFAKSSGTTSSKSKFIPVTKEALESCHFRGGRDVLAIYHDNYPDNGVFSGKTLTLGGSHQINNFSNDSFYGDLSAILIENLPFWTQFFKTPGQDVALMEEWEEKLKKITQVTIEENVTSLAGVPSWFLVLIKHILKTTNKNNLLEVWPNLELFIHGGINFTPYRKQYQEIIPSDQMHYMETYNASEGFFGIQDDPSSSSMLLMLDYGVFFEFMPMSQLGKDHPKTLLLDEVELDKDYAMVISTNGGLWRYLIGDTIRFTNRYPFKFIISGRTKHFINAFGEEVIVDNAIKAINAACNATGAVIKDYTAGPLYMSAGNKGAHQWIIEFEKNPDSLEKFKEVLDKTLQSVNSDYEAKRYKNITLDPPDLIVARKGLFFDWMKSRNKLGGQNKVPRLSNNRDYLDPLLKLNH
ncbi:GH3 auxin-responsive promoter family protein [Thermophagus sp. OGC60D27]|uniref:GH3 auxin-responsive promoter family protein n=1 Tax=Thermophagus sp. OGC60D27 TaxID=3458415 RepID=UPI004037B6E7